MKAFIHIMSATDILIMEIKIIFDHSYIANWEKDEDL